MPIKYLLCLAFEATVSESDVHNWFAEIIGMYYNTVHLVFCHLVMSIGNTQFFIEFPAILLNLQTGRIEDEFHQFVRPTIFPILSKDCIRKTNIRQHIVDDSNPLQRVVSDFERWIRDLCDENGLEMPSSTCLNQHKNYVAMCTWGASDLEYFLQHEYLQKNIELPAYFKFYVDARKEATVSFVRLWVKCCCFQRYETSGNQNFVFHAIQ